MESQLALKVSLFQKIFNCDKMNKTWKVLH